MTTKKTDTVLQSFLGKIRGQAGKLVIKSLTTNLSEITSDNVAGPEDIAAIFESFTSATHIQYLSGDGRVAFLPRPSYGEENEAQTPAQTQQQGGQDVKDLFAITLTALLEIIQRREEVFAQREERYLNLAAGVVQAQSEINRMKDQLRSSTRESGDDDGSDKIDRFLQILGNHFTKQPHSPINTDNQQPEQNQIASGSNINLLRAFVDATRKGGKA